MVMLDRRKLAAPLFAQAAAFVAVLVIGGFTGHASTTAGPAHGDHPERQRQHQHQRQRIRHQGARRTSSPSRWWREGTDGLSVSGSPVNVLEDGTLTSVVSGTLNSALEFAANVPAGQYQVCVDPPIGWGSAVRTTHVLAGWICSAADVRTGPLLVTFRLTPSSLQVGQ